MIEPGIHDMAAERYHADPADRPSLTASMIHLLSTATPLHAWAAHPKLNPEFKRVERQAFDIGTVVHALLLQGEDIVETIHADDWRTKAAKQARDEARELGRIPLLAGDAARVRTIVQAVRAQLEARNDDPPLFTDGKPERTLVWQERDVTCRARVDWLRDDYRTIDDLKSTAKTASPLEWARNTLWSIGADVQVAFYLRGLKRLTKVDAQFRYVLIETTPPYALSVVSLAPSALELGQAKVTRAIETWRHCLRTDTWPGYPEGVYFAESPSWQEARWMEHDAEVVLS